MVIGSRFARVFATFGTHDEGAVCTNISGLKHLFTDCSVDPAKIGTQWNKIFSDAIIKTACNVVVLCFVGKSNHRGHRCPFINVHILTPPEKTTKPASDYVGHVARATSDEVPLAQFVRLASVIEAWHIGGDCSGDVAFGAPVQHLPIGDEGASTG